MVSAGGRHSCALNTDREIVCWWNDSASSPVLGAPKASDD